jgi:hypothetical protein
LCKLQKNLENNIYVKHIVLLSIIFFTLDFTTNSITHPNEKFMTAIMVWIVFLLINRMDIKFTMGAYLILGMMFLNNMYLNYNKESDKNLELFDKILKIFFIIIVLIGIVLYFIKKRNQYKNDWDLLTFIFGVVQCKNNN